jgi:small subunit ribosomal protein S20
VTIVGVVVDADSVGLDGDTTLAFEIHLIEELSAHVAFGDRTSAFKESVGKRRLSMIDVGDDAEIADARLIHCISVRGVPLPRQSQCTVAELWCYPADVPTHLTRFVFVMANIKSQEKRNRQNVHAHERNKAVRSELKTRSKQAIEAAETGDSAQAETALIEAQKKFDMAVSKGVMHKSTAARRKSRLTAQVRSILA